MPWFQMQIHKIERDPTLQIPFYPIDRHLLSNVEDPAETDLGLDDGLVHFLICRDPASEIAFGFFSRHALIIWVSGLDFERHIGGDDSGVITERFHEEELERRFA